MTSDASLLLDYVEKKDQRAFAALVQRHLGLVYSAALRRTRGQSHLAEEISQKVFCDLSRKAAALTHHPTLTGWLYRSTRYAAIDAARAEFRRQKLRQTLTVMPDTSPSTELPANWEQLRPVIDDAMDQLDDRDRELMLLHYFNALTFAEAGARMKLSEDAARKRVGRALDKLRRHLGRRGLTSTTAALGLLLSQTPLVAAPIGLASAVTTTALAVAPTGMAATTVPLVFMSKITAPIVSAALAAGLTGLIWITTAADTVSATELAALRDDNARLAQATAADASPQSVARIANEYSAQATAIARALAERQTHQTTTATASASSTAIPSTSSSAVTPRGHRDHGTATARDAYMTFAWACDICDPEILGKLIHLDAPARAKASEVLATMPDAIRTQYPTPESFYGLLMAASCLESPPPGADLLEKIEMVELTPGRAALPTGLQFQQTPDGWKSVVPLDGVQGLPNVLNSQTLAKLAARTAQP